MKTTDEKFEWRLYHSDKGYDDNQQDADRIRPQVLAYIVEHGRVNAADIYRDTGVADISMYLALHDLIEGSKITGDDPYNIERSHMMTDWWYQPV